MHPLTQSLIVLSPWISLPVVIVLIGILVFVLGLFREEDE